MIVYFADRYLNVIGHASTSLLEGFIINSDNKIEDVETGVASFECTVAFDKSTRSKVEECTRVGNYVLRSNNKGENEFYTIIDCEVDTKTQEAYIYAEDAGLDLLNEVVGEYAADKAYNIAHYIEKFSSGSGFEIGINEIPNLTRKLSWDGEATATERLASVATQFDGCEISYSFEIKNLEVTKRYINIHKERGKDIGRQLRLNKEVDRIVTKTSIANLATAFECTGGTPENSEKPITLKGYTYDDGDFYVSGKRVYSRNALKKWRRYLTTDKSSNAGHIIKRYSYDTTSQATLCAHAITELKKICDMEVNYEVDITRLPEDARIGDRINIIDDAGNLYLSTRILKMESSAVDQREVATLGEFIIKDAGISQKVIELAEQFAKLAVSSARAKAIADAANAASAEALEVAGKAAEDAVIASEAAVEASTAAQQAQESSAAAQQAAGDAQTAVETVEKNVESLEQSVVNAEAAAEQARQAAETAEEKLTEAQTAAQSAASAASEAKTNSEEAVSKAAAADNKADSAKSNADKAIENANAAAITAAAAKLDAENAQKDIDSLGERLETVSKTMEVDYARKTDLTETEAHLQTQISQNAGELSLTALKVQKIDETTNDAHKLLQGALTFAEKAQEDATKAAEAAEAAQAASDESTQAAETAQEEADAARIAAETAQTVADEAEANLAAARADLETIQSRADATEEEIAAAEEAVEAARQAAITAKADCITAVGMASEAQAKADAAYEEARGAQSAANSAASNASRAQDIANEAAENAAEAQRVADEAAAIAEEAQETANEAAETAAQAQQAANEAVANAEAAQKTADDANKIVEQASIDLTTAQQNLSEVMSRVDVTEEEIAAAEDAVAAAQQAAETAQANANAAQSEADTARQSAEAAQAAANNARDAADKAAQAAADAQFAAEEARREVDGLAVRMTNAEAKIHQNAEGIALRATKKEVTETLGGYSTKKETQAALQVTSEEIKNSVSAEYTTKDETSRVETIVQQLADSISQIVRGENGGSLIRQDENGLWYFNIEDIEKSISDTANELDGLSGIVLDANGQIDVLKSTAAALQERIEYVRSYTDENGQPCLELGDGDSVFKVRITNTEIQFAEGTAVPAKLNRKMLVIEKAMVKQELQFGDDEEVSGVWIWKRRSNGNLGLMWKGVIS